MNADAVLAADAAHVWHPYAPVGTTPFGVVTGAEGVRLELSDGRRYITADGGVTWTVAPAQR